MNIKLYILYILYANTIIIIIIINLRRNNKCLQKEGFSQSTVLNSAPQKACVSMNFVLSFFKWYTAII